MSKKNSWAEKKKPTSEQKPKGLPEVVKLGEERAVFYRSLLQLHGGAGIVRCHYPLYPSANINSQNTFVNVKKRLDYTLSLSSVSTCKHQQSKLIINVNKDLIVRCQYPLYPPANINIQHQSST
jgi:hypothetical protein